MIRVFSIQVGNLKITVLLKYGDNVCIFKSRTQPIGAHLMTEITARLGSPKSENTEMHKMNRSYHLERH